MANAIRTVVVLSLLMLAVGAVWWVNHWLYETTCIREVRSGLVKHECRRYWDLCERYYSDCRDVDRTKPPRVYYKLVPVTEPIVWTEDDCASD